MSWKCNCNPTMNSKSTWQSSALSCGRRRSAWRVVLSPKTLPISISTRSSQPPMEDGTIRLDIRIFTGEATEKYLKKFKVRTGQDSHDLRAETESPTAATTFDASVRPGIMSNIMNTKAWLEDENGARKEILSFGPLCIAPQYQRQKLGKLLIEHSFDAARKMGYDVNINFGNPGNYVSRGFVSCKKKNVSFVVPGNFPTALLVCELVPGALDGRPWMYIPSTAADCCEDTAAVEAFDANFPQKEKAWMPSQEEFYIYRHSSVVR